MCNSKLINVSDIDQPSSVETQSLMSSLLEGVWGFVQRDDKISITTGTSSGMPMSEEHRDYLLGKFPSLAELGSRRAKQEATFPEVGDPVSDVLYTIDPSLVSDSMTHIILKESK